jgi:hypothetical protein
MKKLTLVTLFIFLFCTNALADVTKKTKTEVKFTGLGTYSLVSVEKISGFVKVIDFDSSLTTTGAEGQKLHNYLNAASIIIIIDLPMMKSTYITPSDQAYTSGKIIKAHHQVKPTEPKENQAGIVSDNLDVKVTTNEFTVTDTGEQKVINSFPCRKYRIVWAYEWEDLIGGERGYNRMENTVWTTELNPKLNQIKAEEGAFNNEYLEKTGIVTGEFGEVIFGSKWLEILTSIDKNSSTFGMPQAAVEMQQLKGYPIMIDGTFYSNLILPNQQGPQANAPTVPKLTFHIEVESLSDTPIKPVDLKVPETYKKR